MLELLNFKYKQRHEFVVVISYATLQSVALKHFINYIIFSRSSLNDVNKIRNSGIIGIISADEKEISCEE